MADAQHGGKNFQVTLHLTYWLSISFARNLPSCPSNWECHFQNLFKSIPNVHVHIRAVELKALVYYTLLPKYLQWSQNMALDVNECELCTKDWVKILPKVLDIDAITEKFFLFK